jgi:hypothetical protein
MLLLVYIDTSLVEAAIVTLMFESFTAIAKSPPTVLTDRLLCVDIEPLLLEARIRLLEVYKVSVPVVRSIVKYIFDE